MKNIQFYGLLFTFFMSVFYANAQYYTSGSDPAHIKWNKIETENFKVVFPEDYKAKAQCIAKVLEEVYKYGGNSLNHKPKKINVLVHSETAYSNGFVTWAPKRIELYATPNQRMHSQEWLQQLAIHEFRHVVQIDKVNNGFTKMLSYIIGEQVVGGVLGLYLPMWFLEGDAVTTETALTLSGRGRSPWFEQGMRAQLMDKKLYSYEKASFGSYKDFVPNHYEMGYQLVAGARKKYGPEIWEYAVLNSGRNPQMIIPFNEGQKKVTQINKIDLYNNTFKFLHQEWEKQDIATRKTEFIPISTLDKSFVNFQYPVQVSENEYIAELNGPGEIQRFVEVSENGEFKTVFVPGTRSREPFSYANNTICWAESEPDPRWENRAYSVIKCYHIPSGKVQKITCKSRYFSPAISPNGELIATVFADTKNNYSLVLLNKKDGSILGRYEYGDNAYLLTPRWNSTGNSIVCIAMSEKGKSVVTFNTKTEEWKQITTPSYADISLPTWQNNYCILFTAGYSGTEEVYAVNIENKEVRQLTQTKYGATGAFAFQQGKGLVYSQYTADGYQLVKTDSSSFVNIPVLEVVDYSVQLHKKISDQEKGRPDFSKIDQIDDYEVKKYSKWNLFNFHSWAPAFINLNDAEVNVGASAVSQNLLGTAITSVGLNLDPQMSREKYYFNFQYTGWYPVLEFEVKHGHENIKYNPNQLYASETDTFSLNADTKMLQTRIKMGTYVPINLTRSKYNRLLQPSIDYNFIHQSDYELEKTTYSKIGDGWTPVEQSTLVNPELNYHSFEYGIYFHNLLKRSNRDVTTRWGQLINLKYSHTPSGNFNVGSIAGLRTRLYFPGFLKHHSIRLDNNYQYKEKGDEYQGDDVYVNNYKFGDYFNFPRGYGSYNNDELYSFKGDYIFPLWNPDVTVPGLVYLKRITSNLYYDFTRTTEKYTYEESGNSFTQINNYKSFGAEFRGEVHVFRFLYPITVGYRYARLVNFNQNKHEFLLGVNISGFSLGKE